MLKKSLTEPNRIVFDLFTNFDKNLLDLVVIVVALCTLIYTVAYGLLNKQRFQNGLAKTLLAIYFTFIGCSTVIACKQAYF